MQLIDAGMIAFSAWHALKGRVEWPLTFQVPRMLRPLIEKTRDTYVLCWNGDRQWKRARLPSYRDRPEIWDHAGAEDFQSMLAALNALGAVQIRIPDREADEVLAALVHHLPSGEEIVIRSDDKDFMQLLSGSTRMEGRVRGSVRFSDVKGILGVTPAYVADFLALSGDKVDGIPRIVTPGMARKLIESRGHIGDWIDRDLKIDGRVKRTLEDNRDQLWLNLELVDLSQEGLSRTGLVGIPPPIEVGWGDPARAREIGERTGASYLAADSVAQDFAGLKEWGEKTRMILI